MTQPEMHDKPPVWFDGETMVIRASGLAGCTRAMAALATGYDAMLPPDAMQRRFDDGHLHEASIIAEMEKQAECQITGCQDDVVVVVKKGLEIRGHVDGLVVDELGRKGVAEAKSFSDLMFKKYLASGLDTFEGYRYQITAYMLGTGSEFALYGVKNKNSGQVNVRDIVAPMTKGELFKRALEIEKVVKAAMAGENAALMSCGDRTQYPCPVFYLHEEKPQSEVVEDEVLRGMVEAYDQARAEAKDATDRQTRLADEIKMRLEVIGEERVEVGQFHVTATYGSRSSLDEKALVADHPGVDLSRYKVKKQNSKPTLTVTKNEGVVG